MSSLKVKQIHSKLIAMFAQHLDQTDLSSNDPEREQKILTRCLTAFALYLQAGCTEKEAAEAVWDGADDNGIDGVLFDTTESRVVIVQSKFINKGSGEPEAADVGTFVKGVKDIIEQNVDNFHPRLHARIGDISARLSTPGTSVHIVLVTTGASQLAKHGLSHIKSLLESLNGEDPDPIADYEIMGLNEVYGGLAHDPYKGNLILDATVLEWSYVAAPHGAYFGMIDGLQLKEWWKAHGKGLLAANIRHSLGQTEVNNQIRATAIAVPEKFWYYNNGITLIADEKLKAPLGAASKSSGNFRFRNASLVNGAQTVSSLAKVEDDEKLGRVRVPFRVILLTDTPAGFGQEVTRTNNLQNRIEPRDFVAQDPEQSRLRMEMAIEDVDYQFVRSEEAHAATDSNSCELIEVTTALACASGDANLAVQVKTGFSRIFADLSKAPYKALFNPAVTGAKAFNACVVQRQIDAWIEKKKKGLAKKSGPALGVLVHGNRILAAAVFRGIDSAALTQPINAFGSVLPTLAVDEKCDSAYGKMLQAIEEHYANKFLAVLFKNPSISKHVYELAA
ncbi:AIPR family protein [Achromobacter insolitus]|uniref:AIPR family protein n=1 Tax=Achromobacter insolitus TaxID=217204 RepID=UPI0027DFE5AC|nr:AIPR family protein [Achromobacter insolitus]MDQ6211704.1 AIPR family protein [Achromobacter insolitus]